MPLISIDWAISMKNAWNGDAAHRYKNCIQNTVIIFKTFRHVFWWKN